MDNDDILKRIFDKLDKYDERLNTTCNTISRIDEKLDNFIETVEKKTVSDVRKAESKFKVITVIFGCITAISVIFGLIRSIS